jgi:hypothetical protein
MHLRKFWPLPAAALVLAAGGFAFAATRVPADLDYSLSHASDNGLYAVTVTPGVDPVPVGRLHTWVVGVTAPDGTPVDADIAFDGGMPQHGHGLPTVPKAMGRDKEGRTVIGGVRFNMPGWWEVKVHVHGAAGEDTATFNLAL